MGLYTRRVLGISSLLAERSLLLFGPRQTGKSSYVKHQLSGSPDYPTTYWILVSFSVFLPGPVSSERKLLPGA